MALFDGVFPLIKLAKKLKVTKTMPYDSVDDSFPLIKLAKKLKAGRVNGISSR